MSSHPLEVQTVAGGAVIKFHAQALDDANIHALGEGLLRLVDELDQRQLYFDLGEVEGLGSMGLTKLVALLRKVQASGGKLTLQNVNGPVYEALQITRLTTLFDVRRNKAAG